MRLLLDTPVILWWLDDAPQLSEEAKHLLDSADPVHISAVSPWEITFKPPSTGCSSPRPMPIGWLSSRVTP
ncbi:type II toxin-antitoxin system VapC family toxin [Streptomyces anulatus]